jgi:hypothetical protein
MRLFLRDDFVLLMCFRHVRCERAPISVRSRPFEQRFGRDAETPAGFIKLLEERGELLEHRVHLALVGPQPMIGGAVALRFRTVRKSG